jgi:protein transport protein SEC61 subunit gamma-like protein
MFLICKIIYLEFATIARATGIGFLIMGFTGFFVKLIHIPINNIIVGGV